jgi:hypothetical protein
MTVVDSARFLKTEKVQTLEAKMVEFHVRIENFPSKVTIE